MAVTYRAIERHSARRVSSTLLTSSSSGFDSNVRTLKQARQMLCRAAASLYCARLFKSILNRRYRRHHHSSPAELNLLGTLRLWLINFVLFVYVTCYLTPYLILTSVAKWTFRMVLTIYYSRNGVVCVTFDDHPTGIGAKNKESRSRCWTHSVYLVDSGRVSPADLRRSILDSVKNQAALRLVRKPEAFGWIHLWKQPESTLRMSSVQELSPVWKHQLVNEDSVQEYVSEVFGRPDGLETDGQQPPWRIYLIPLIVISGEKNLSSWSNCCLVVRCHRLLSQPLDRLIRTAIQQRSLIQPEDGTRNKRPSQKTVQNPLVLLDPPHRLVANGGIHVSWTRPIASTDFIDRICHLTGATCHQIVLAAFCQSINQSYRQSASSALLKVEMTVGSSSSSTSTTTSSSSSDCLNREYYSLPLGSSALDDGQLLLETLKRQLLLLDRNAVARGDRMLPVGTWVPFRTRTDSSAMTLSVSMETVSASCCSDVIGTVFHWSSPPTRWIPIRLCLWNNESVVRLGLTQHHQLEFPVRAVDIERRIHQLAAGLGVHNRHPLSPHSSPSSSPQRLTPPPTPRL